MAVRDRLGKVKAAGQAFGQASILAKQAAGERLAREALALVEEMATENEALRAEIDELKQAVWGE